jgi:Tfp pilus assembly protein PilN
MDLKKEIKLSDLFRRRRPEGPPAGEAVADAEQKPTKESRRLFARKPKEPKAQKPPKSDKQPKERKRRKEPKLAEKEALPLPAVPLMRAFNLLQQDEARDKASNRLGVAQVGVALFALVVIAALGSAYIFMSGRISDRQAEVDALKARLAELDVPAEETGGGSAAALVSEADSRRRALAAALSGRIAWDRVLRQFSLVLPENVYLLQLSAGSSTTGDAAASPNSLTISGTAATQSDVAEVLARLTVLPEFESVRLESSTRQQEDAGTGFAFAIAATIGPSTVAP